MSTTINAINWIYDTSSNDTSSTEPFRRKGFLSKCHFVECPLRRNIFRIILSTKYFVPTWPPYCICLLCDYGSYDCEVTDFGRGKHSGPPLFGNLLKTNFKFHHANMSVLYTLRFSLSNWGVYYFFLIFAQNIFT